MRHEIQSIPWDSPNFDREGLMSRCQYCGHGLNAFDSRVLGALGDGSHLVHTHCRGCRGGALLKVAMDNKGIVVQILLTDLSYDDCRQRAEGVAAISIDDVLDVHHLLLEEAPGRDFIDDILDHTP